MNNNKTDNYVYSLWFRTKCINCDNAKIIMQEPHCTLSDYDYEVCLANEYKHFSYNKSSRKIGKIKASIDKFTQLMLNKMYLAMGLGKDGWDTINEDNRSYLLAQLEIQLTKYKSSLSSNEDCKNHLINIGNYAMMLWNYHRYLGLTNHEVEK